MRRNHAGSHHQQPRPLDLGAAHKSTVGRQQREAWKAYGIKKLRELILELAVRGKLVPQDPNDEAASELLKQIAAEKSILGKRGSKKETTFPELGKREEYVDRCRKGWEWVRFGSIAQHKVRGW